MFANVVIGSNDVAASKVFYDAILATLGVQEGEFNEQRQRLYYRAPDALLIITKPLDGNMATAANGSSLGFTCKTPEQAKAFHDAGVANGGISIEDPPGWRDYGAGRRMYLAYVRDPSGHKICAAHNE
jgi:catechol 2,3-dioxygenase-like lactoylglutathione lyase family enzyme